MLCSGFTSYPTEVALYGICILGWNGGSEGQGGMAREDDDLVDIEVQLLLVRVDVCGRLETHHEMYPCIQPWIRRSWLHSLWILIIDDHFDDGQL
jgi:hypothetical protein